MTVFQRTVDQISPDSSRERSSSSEVRLPRNERVSGGCFRHNPGDVQIAFCPERIAEGHALEELSACLR